MSAENSMSITEALEWLTEVFEEPEHSVAADTEREDIEGWDSLGTLTLLAELDEKLDITLSEEELEDLTNIRDLLDILRKHKILQD